MYFALIIASYNVYDFIHPSIRILGENHKDIGLYHNNIGDIHHHSRNYSLAIKEYDIALSIYQKQDNKDEASIAKLIADSLANQARSFILRDQNNDIDNASNNLTRATIIYNNLFGNVHLSLIIVYIHSADIAKKQNELIRELRYLIDAYHISSFLFESNNTQQVWLRKRLQISYANPKLLQKFKSLKSHEIENIEWYHEQIGHIYFNFYFVRTFPEYFDITVKMIEELNITPSMLIKEDINNLRNARVYFQKSENNEMLNIIQTILKD